MSMSTEADSIYQALCYALGIKKINKTDVVFPLRGWTSSRKVTCVMMSHDMYQKKMTYTIRDYIKGISFNLDCSEKINLVTFKQMDK